MTYEEALQKINDRLLFGVKPGLERIQALCDALGNPEKRTRFVHVAGTNGKGTTCTLIASVLHAAGYRTGLYTSPYVLDFRERFRIDGEMIPKTELVEAVERVLPAAEKLEAAGETVTEFEFITVLALDWFARRGCGIPDIEKAMEPLYTTGGEERAGLGFAVMQSFCDRVRVSSAPGRGTTVTLTKQIAPRSDGE